MRKMRFGISIPNAGNPAELVDFAVEAEAAGWDGFFLWDHVQIDAKSRPPVLDPWVLLGAIAARTERVKLGALVTPVPRRRPWKLAKEIVTLDLLSGGRVIVGVGLGYPPEDEYGAFGESTDQKEHAAMLDEALPLLDGLLRGDRVDHEGPHYRIHAQMSPTPVQRPRPPIWVAAMLPYRKGVVRSLGWDGLFPIKATQDPVTPEDVAALKREHDFPAGFDIVVGARVSNPDEFADVGVTWCIDGPSGPEETLDDLRRELADGPPRG